MPCATACRPDPAPARHLLAGALIALAGCAGPQPGEDRLLSATLVHDGIEREYLLFVPRGAGASAAPRPLVLALHGGGGTARAMVRLTYGRFNELADAHGFFVAYPQGVGKAWNDGRDDPAAPARRAAVDDVGFISALIERLRAEHVIDARRVFATGISNGGLMSFRLACAPDPPVRAIAPVTASIPRALATRCRHGAPVGLVLFNGSDDPLVPYDGGQIRVFGKARGEVIPTQETILLWRERNGCAGVAERTELPDASDDGTRVTRIRYADCAAGTAVVLYRIEGGGHTWPGGYQYLGERLVGRSTRDIDAADEIWRFFATLP